MKKKAPPQHYLIRTLKIFAIGGGVVFVILTALWLYYRASSSPRFMVFLEVRRQSCLLGRLSSTGQIDEKIKATDSWGNPYLIIRREHSGLDGDPVVTVISGGRDGKLEADAYTRHPLFNPESPHDLLGITIMELAQNDDIVTSHFLFPHGDWEEFSEFHRREYPVESGLDFLKSIWRDSRAVKPPAPGTPTGGGAISLLRIFLGCTQCYDGVYLGYIDGEWSTFPGK